MNKIYMILAFSIFIFLIVIFSILALVLNHKVSEKKPIVIDTTDTTISQQNTPSIYNDYAQDPDYNTINIEYQIIGTLSSTTNNPETVILPLYGKQIKSFRWKYYTIVNSLKIDIYKDGDSCMKECEMLSRDDIVKIPAYNETTFKVSLYDYKPPF